MAEWPRQVQAAYAISIRPERYAGLQRRLAPWKDRVSLFPGTDGAQIDRSTWSAARLKSGLWKGKPIRRGQMGCYDSHVRLWQKIARQHTGPILVLEDDAGLAHTPRISELFRSLFATLEKRKIPWDVIYLGHFGTWRGAGRVVAPGIREATQWQGLFCYLIKPDAARLLASHAWPMREPVDVYMQRFISSKRLRVLRAVPRFCFVVTLQSDTTEIQ